MREVQSFEYGGYHFTPLRRFRGNEGDFFAISRRLETDPQLGICTYKERQKIPYDYEGFYAASTDKSCDIFRCDENGRMYVPGRNELFIYHDPLFKDTMKESVIAGLKEIPVQSGNGISGQPVKKEPGHGR